MKKSIMKKWITALKSGKYKQTRGTLKGKRGYCCLGVLCDIHDDTKWTQDVCGFNGYGNGLEEGGLTNTVKKWAGVNTTNGDVDGMIIRNGDSLSLVHLNDKRHWGFKKIAKFIEKNYKKI